MKPNKILFSLIFIIFLAGSVNAAIGVSGEWQNEQTSIEITNGESVNFNAYFGSMYPPLTINVILYDSADNWKYDFDKNKVINDYAFSKTYTISQSIYGSAGDYYVLIKGKDGVGSIQSSILNLKVNPVTPTNNLPVLTPIGSQTVNENQLLGFTVNATDLDGNSLTYSASNLPTGASFSGQTFSWTPTFTQSGSYSVTFAVSDGNGGSDSETITITVNDVNRIPTLGSIGSQTVNENTLYTYQVTATDADVDVLTYTLLYTRVPEWLFINSATGLITGTAPQVDGNAPLSVIVEVSDSKSKATQNFVITVKNVVTPPTNNAPVLAAIGNKSTDEGVPLNFVISANDPDGNSLTYSASNLPTGASFSGQTFSWTPTFTQSGSYSVSFSVSDGNGGSDSETITITVNDVPAVIPDTTAPIVFITSPQNGVIYSSQITGIIFTASDNIALASCSYSLNGTTTTTTPCNQAITGISSVEGANTWTIYATDTSGNIGSATVNFVVDLSPSSKKEKKGAREIIFRDIVPEEEPTPVVITAPSIIKISPKPEEKSFLIALIEAIIDFFRKLFGLK